MDKRLTVSITTGTVIKTLILLAIAWLAVQLWGLILIVLTAVVIASAVEPGARFFMRWRMPRILSVLIVYVVFFAVFIGFFYVFMPPMLAQSVTLLSSLPSYVQNLQSSDLPGITSSLGATFSVPQLVSSLTDTLNGFSTHAFAAASTIFGGLFSFVLIVVFSFYFAVSETGIDDFLRIVTPKKNQRYVIDLWRRSQRKIGLWMQGQLLLAVIIGLLVFLGLTLAGVPYALVLAVLAGLCELIPIFGPILAAIPALAIAFSAGGLSLAIIVLAIYVIIQQFENHLIYPLVVTKVVGVPPLLVILALIIGAQMAGFLGIILSVPFSAAIQEFVNDFTKRRGFVFGEEE